MADPGFGYSTLQIIPTLKGATQTLDKELGQVLSKVGTAAGKDAGQAIAKGISSADSEVSASAKKLADSASKGAGDSGEDIGKKLGDGVNDGLKSSTSDLGSDLERKLKSGTDLGSTGDKIGRDFGSSLSDGARDEIRPLAGFGTDVGNDVGANFQGGIGGSLGGLVGVFGDALGGVGELLANPATIIGGGVAVAFSKGIADAINFDGVQAKIRAGLGATKAEADKLGDVTKNLFRGNYGDSIEQVGEAVTKVTRNAEALGIVGKKQLGEVTAAALTTASVFDQDLNGSINAASQLIRTGLAKNSTEAFDLITVGLQGTANKSDDLLDTFNEYSTQFRQLGVSGPQALGLITQAIEGGARDADLAADAFKEFAIRAQADTKDTRDGFAGLGLDFTAVSDAIAAGGPRAADALDLTLDRLRAIKDPVEQARVGVLLFGTQYEDLQGSLDNVDLSTATDGLGDISGAAKKAQDNVAGLQSNIEKLKRTGGGIFQDVAEELLNPAGSLIDNNEGWTKYGKSIGDAVLDGLIFTYTGIPGLLAKTFTPNQAGELGQATGEFYGQGFKAGITNEKPWDWWQDNNLDGWRRSVLDAKGPTADFSEEVDKLGDRGKLARAGLDSAATGADSFLQSIADSSSLDDMLSSALSLQDAMSALFLSVGDIGNVDISDVANGLTGVSREAEDALRNIGSVGDAAQQQISNVLQFQGADAARAAADKIRDGLMNIFDTAGLSDEQVHELLETMGLLKPQIETAITVSGTDVAIAQIQLLKDFIGGELDSEGNAKLRALIAVKIADQDFTAAAQLLSAFTTDMQDGTLDNPILLSINADTSTADGTIDDFLAALGNKPPTDLHVGANTQPGIDAVGLFQASTNLTHADIGVGADLSQANKDIAGFFANNRTLLGLGVKVDGRRASGGPVLGGDTYLVGENGPELFTSQRDGQILNQQQLAQGFNSTAPAGQSQATWNIYETTSARDTAESVARMQRRVSR